MNIPFISTKIYEGHYPINFYFQTEAWNGRPALIGTPGLLEWVDTANNAEVRGIHRLTANIAYAVVGNKVFRLSAAGVATECDNTLDSITGLVEMSSDGTYLMIVEPDMAGHYVTGTTVTKITDTDFPSPSSLTFQDGYHIVTETGTGKFFISPQNDPSGNWNALDYSTAEGSPDYAVRGFMSHREFFVFGEDSIEPYQNTGNADFPFERLPGRFVEHGLGARGSVAKFVDNLIWLADDFSVRTFSQGVPTPATPATLSAIINGYTTKIDAFGYTFKKDGNSFYSITFPSEDKTWLLNSDSTSWCQWSSGLLEGRHRANCHCYFNGKNLVGDYENGKIYELSDTTYTDDGSPIKRKRISPVLFDPERLAELSYPYLEVEFKAGVGLVAGQGSDPTAMLRYSDDGCREWSNEEWVKVGKLGEYKWGSRWDMLGSAKMRNFEISMTDPIEWVIVNAYSPVVKN